MAPAERVYLTVAEVISIHSILIEEFGGSHGVRDAGLLESAVFRPQIGYYNNIAEEAAALMESLANNHAFHDGNKRAAFAATDTFLEMNGYYLEVDARQSEQFIREGIARGQFRFSIILSWINANLRPTS
jgi:death on curing protein